MAVLITITTSGGIGGFGLPGRQTTVETHSLPEPLRDEICRNFHPNTLERLAGAGKGTGADRITYHITVTADSGESDTYDVQESAMPEQMIDLIDSLK